MPHRRRQAVRALLIDPDGRVLLQQFELPWWRGWVLPGGGVDPGEGDHQALRRELAEECGAPPGIEIGPVVVRRSQRLRTATARITGQDETVYLLRCPRFRLAPSLPDGQLRAEGVTAQRWWSAAELAVTPERLAPRGLPGLVADILDRGGATRVLREVDLDDGPAPSG